MQKNKPCNTNQKNAGGAVLISDNADFKQVKLPGIMKGIT